MAEPLGIYRIEVETATGPAHWGQAYTDADEAQNRLGDARDANPDASSVRVVSLMVSESGKTSRWEEVS